MTAAAEIRRLTPADVAQYRAIMLRAYDETTDVFTSTVAEREPLPLAWWATRLEEGPEPKALVVGALVEGQVVGVAGLDFEQRPRTRHKAKLFGMFVLQGFGRRGIGRALVEELLQEVRSRPEVRVVQLTVTETNTTARRLYESCGFRAFGTEPFANRYGDRFVPLVHMWRPVGSDPV